MDDNQSNSESTVAGRGTEAERGHEQKDRR